jgi:hypothetical protein
MLLLMTLPPKQITHHLLTCPWVSWQAYGRRTQRCTRVPPPRVWIRPASLRTALHFLGALVFMAHRRTTRRGFIHSPHNAPHPTPVGSSLGAHVEIPLHRPVPSLSRTSSNTMCLFPTIPTTTAGVPAEPGSRVPDAQEQRRKRRLLIIHSRLARFFTCFITFTRAQVDDKSAINHIAILGLYVRSFVRFPFVSSADDPRKNIYCVPVLSLMVILTLTFITIDSQLVVYAASSIHSRSAGSGISGKTTLNGYSPTCSPPD